MARVMASDARAYKHVFVAGNATISRITMRASRADTTFADGTQAHKDRYESERLIPVFQSLGLTAEVVATTEFATCEADSLYMR